MNLMELVNSFSKMGLIIMELSLTDSPMVTEDTFLVKEAFMKAR